MILMNMTGKKKIWNKAAMGLLLITVTLAGISVPVAYGQEEAAFERLTQRFEDGQIFTADFSHIYIDSYTDDTLSSSGRIWVGENRYKVQGKEQTVVVDGKTSMVYDENRNRVIISKYEPEEDDFAPSRILNGVDSTFTVEKQERVAGEVLILLRSQDPFALYQEVEIFLTPALVPTRIRAVDPADNLTITTFDEGSFIRMEEGMFRLEYPDGAEVVDMRN